MDSDAVENLGSKIAGRGEQVRSAVSSKLNINASSGSAGVFGGGAWRDELSARAEHGRDQVRSWVAEDGGGDPRFREVMDSLVRRGDKGSVLAVEAAVRDLPADEQRRVWTEFAALPTIAERDEYARELREGKR